MVNEELNAGEKLASDPGGSRNIASYITLQKAGIGSGTDGPLGLYADFTLIFRGENRE